MKLEMHFMDDIIPDKYAKAATETVHGMAVNSFPFEVTNLHEATKTLAWTLIDYDAVPVCGFPYIHWLVANVPVYHAQIKENFSRLDQEHLEGKNSLVSKFLPAEVKEIDQQYIGPKPPDKDHQYLLTVYGIDKDLDLENGFYLNDFLRAIEGHIVEEASINLIGKY